MRIDIIIINQLQFCKFLVSKEEEMRRVEFDVSRPCPTKRPIENLRSTDANLADLFSRNLH